MLSITPEETRKPSFGLPKRLNASALWYSGRQSMATR